jgi:dihydrofolate reductase
MKRLTSIVAVNLEGAIGAQNALPWRLKTDMRFFKQQTTGNVAIMGRKTFESIGSRPLPNRCNVVLSHSFNLFPETENCLAATGIEEGLVRAAQAAGKKKEGFVVGGATMYEQFAPFVDRYLVTIVDKQVPEADTFIVLDFLSATDRWDKELILSQSPDAENEAAFEIWEFTSRKIVEISERRSEVVARLSALAGRSRESAARSRSASASTVASALLF